VPAVRPTRILVVDDNRDSAESMALLLRSDGHKVWTARDGEEALEVTLRERPAVVLLDIGLPGLNGYQACRLIREAGLTDTLVIAMTGYGHEQDRQLSQEACFDAHLVKPVDLTTLQQLLGKRVAGH
jgi:CheY-like chemotaxis protein